MASIVARYIPQVGQTLQRPVKEAYDETLGLLKYAQDNTIQPWMDLGHSGYQKFKNWDGLIPKATKPDSRKRFEPNNSRT